MERYTSIIPHDLAEKLQKKGMPLMTSVSISIVEDKPVVDEDGKQWYRPSYAEVFDFFLDRGLDVEVYLVMSVERANCIEKDYEWVINSDKNGNEARGDADCMTWHEAANAAIEKALELIKED